MGQSQQNVMISNVLSDPCSLPTIRGCFSLRVLILLAFYICWAGGQITKEEKGTSRDNNLWALSDAQAVVTTAYQGRTLYFHITPSC